MGNGGDGGWQLGDGAGKGNQWGVETRPARGEGSQQKQHVIAGWGVWRMKPQRPNDGDPHLLKQETGLGLMKTYALQALHPLTATD